MRVRRPPAAAADLVPQPQHPITAAVADRSYQRDGTLTPRGEPGAVIGEEAAAVEQVRRMVESGAVRATDGSAVPIAADTVCLHGDHPRAVEFARRLREELAAAGTTVKAFRG